METLWRSSMTTPIRDVLVVGLGAIGTICESTMYSSYQSRNDHIMRMTPDSLILKRSARVRVTAVARSNFSHVQREFGVPWGDCLYDTRAGHGMDIRSKKYGDIPDWKPDRRQCAFFAYFWFCVDLSTQSSTTCPTLSTESTLSSPLPRRLYRKSRQRHPCWRPSSMGLTNFLSQSTSSFKMGLVSKKIYIPRQPS